jgi:ParB-like nuclease domain
VPSQVSDTVDDFYAEAVRFLSHNCYVAAQDNLSYEQLAMFMPAHEVMAKTGEQSPDRLLKYNGQRETPDEMWDRKTKEAKSRRLTSSIKKQGIKKPVQMANFMGGKVLFDGHHRVAAAHSLDPNHLVPVSHY